MLTALAMIAPTVRSKAQQALAASPPTTDVYAGGQIALIPANGGPLTFVAPGLADAVFDAGLQPIGVGAGPEAVCHPHHRFAFPDFGGRDADDSE